MNFRVILNLLATPIEYGFDTLKTFKWSKASPLSNKNKKQYYDIILLAHTVEKGLSVTDPRKKFGVEKITQLLNLLTEYEWNYDPFPVEKAYGCLSEYIQWHKNIDFDLGEFGMSINAFILKCEKAGLHKRGGLKNISNSNITSIPLFEEALNNRSSCRQFTSEVVNEDTLKKIASIVVRTPSQCNRQSSRVHYYSDKRQIDQLLKLQAGAEGFRESVSNLFVISSDLTAWSGVKARSQAYVDASLTAMQVMNACQSLGLASCPLNLAITNRHEIKICKAGDIPSNERLVMMIAFGHPEKIELKVARSERISLDSALIKH